MQIKKINQLLLTSIFSALTGCAGMNGDFSCNKTAGDSCMSISHVNKEANSGHFNRDDSRQLKGNSVVPASSGLQKTGGYSVSTPTPGEPIRYGEGVQRIWIAPYEDVDGNYHEPSYVYTVIRPSHWLGIPQKAIIENEES